MDHSDLADMSCTFLEFHGVFDISPAAKIRSAGDNVIRAPKSVGGYSEHGSGCRA
jgi:hypothetical protein